MKKNLNPFLRTNSKVATNTHFYSKLCLVAGKICYLWVSCNFWVLHPVGVLLYLVQYLCMYIFLDQEVASTLPLALEVQSSTESDKTVLSLKHNNYNNNKAGISVSGDDLNNSVPNSPGGGLSLCNSPRSGSSNNLITTISRHKLSLNLPEIIVQPCSPPPTSPSLESSPTSNNNVDINKKESSSSTNSSSSSISLGTIRSQRASIDFKKSKPTENPVKSNTLKML